MSFDDVIKQQREQQNQIATASVEFMTVRELFEALVARYPDQSLETFSQQLFKIFQEKSPFPDIYHRNSENIAWEKLPLMSMRNQYIDKSDLFCTILAKGYGRYHSISGILDSVTEGPLEKAGLELYGLRRADVPVLLGFDIETTPAPAVSDYVLRLEKENAALKADIKRMQESYQPPTLKGEPYAAHREEIFIAALAVLHELDRKGKLKPDGDGLHIPNAARLEQLLDQKAALFWPLARKPPVGTEKIKAILREPGRLLRDKENPDLEQRRRDKQEKNKKIEK